MDEWMGTTDWARVCRPCHGRAPHWSGWSWMLNPLPSSLTALPSSLPYCRRTFFRPPSPPPFFDLSLQPGWTWTCVWTGRLKSIRARSAADHQKLAALTDKIQMGHPVRTQRKPNHQIAWRMPFFLRRPWPTSGRTDEDQFIIRTRFLPPPPH